jgi:hypothetical protein
LGSWQTSEFIGRRTSRSLRQRPVNDGDPEKGLQFVRRCADQPQDDVEQKEGVSVLLSCRATSPAPESQIMAEMAQVLDRRGAMKHAPVSVAISDAVALGIAAIFSSPTASGQVMERFYRRGSTDSNTLLEAVRFEQGYASAEGHAALHCLAGWVRAQVHARGERE